MFSLSRAPLRAILLGAAAMAAFPLSTQAQDDATVDSLIVTAVRDPEDPPVVGAARERLSETPGAVAVVSAETYENRYAPTLADTLRGVAGVYAQNKFGEDIRISIRGSGIGNNNHNRGVIIAQDGIPFNEADGFGDFQLADPMAARFTEVYKGGNALRFGGALLGGAVNLVSPTGRTAEAEKRIRVETGSYDTYRLHGQFAREGELWDGFAALTGIEADGFRDHNETQSIRLSGNIARTFGEDREVRAYLSAGDVGQQIAGALTLDQALNAPRMANATNKAMNYQRNMQALRGSLQTNWRLDDSTVLTGGVYAVWKDLDHPIFQVIDQQSRTYGVFGRLDWSGQLGSRQADLFAGLWYRDGNIDNERWVNLAGARGALTAKSFDESTATDLFAEGRLWLSDNLIVTAGGSLGWATRDFTGAVPVLNAQADYDWFAPRIGLIWQAMDGAQVYANLTKSVEPPNMSAFVQSNTPRPDLRPQEAWTAEVGTRGRRGPYTWDFTVYRAQLDGELLSFNINPGLGIPASTFNAQDTVHQGLEAALDWRLAPGWRLRQTYSWSDFRFDGDAVYGDNRLPIVPEHFYRAEVRYQGEGGWFVAPAVEWQMSDVFVDFNNAQTAPDFAIASLTAGFSPREGARVFVEVRNLFDESYVSNVSAVIAGTPNSVTYWPGEGRTIFAGLTADF